MNLQIFSRIKPNYRSFHGIVDSNENGVITLSNNIQIMSDVPLSKGIPVYGEGTLVSMYPNIVFKDSLFWHDKNPEN